MSVPARAVLATGIAVTVLAAVIAGLVLLGAPSEERARKLDARRISDLRAVASAVDRYWTTHNSLPPSLEALASQRDMSVELLDPETGRPYDYEILDAAAYALCAQFARASSDAERRLITDSMGDGAYADFWSHTAGRYCFRLEPQSTT